MDIERTARQLQSVTGLIGILGGLVAAIAVFNRQLREAIELFASLGVFGLLAVAAVLLAAGLLLILAARRKGSRLLDPDALRLDPRRPEHLIGRVEDVRLLLEKCEARPLTFLVGDSGSGKSALVQAGLLRAAAADGRLLPVYLDMADLDWQTGPLAALADRFWRCLSAEERSALAVERPPLPGSLPGLLAACYPTLGRTPLIVLDQIDDYQLRHRDLFLPATRTWLTAAELIAANAFWAKLADLLGARAAHLLLVTRSDNADGLESLRLVGDPLVVRLDPLPPGFVLGVLDRLTARPPDAPPVIENPEQGWTRLRLRLADDLERGGAVLPQQLKVALMGLTRLKLLSAVAYDRAGGVEGLEARYIEDALARAAARAGLRPAAVRAAVTGLVEREGPRRSAPLPAAELAGGMADRDAARLDAALQALEQSDILRRREAEGVTVWQLDHDYLTRGILKAEADADRWKSLLARRAREFADARGSLRARWRARLTAREQLGFLFARLLGRFRYGELRRFAMLSAVPYAAVGALLGLLVVGGGAAVEVARGELVWRVVEPSELSPPLELLGLAEIAQSGLIARATFAYRLFSNPEFARRAAAKPEPMVRALVGLDEGRAGMLVKWLVASQLPDGDLRSAQAAAAILPFLPRSARLALRAPLPDAPGDARAEKSALDDLLLTHVAARASSEAAGRMAASALERLKGGSGEGGSRAEYDRGYAAGVLASASQDMPVGQLPDALSAIREQLRASRGHAPAVSTFARAYSVLAGRLPPDDRVEVIGDLIEEMRAHRGNPDALRDLALAETVAARGLPAELAQEAADALLAELLASRGDPYAALPLAMAYAATAPATAAEGRAAAAAVVLEELRGSRRAGALVGYLAEIFAALTLPLPTKKAELAETVSYVREALKGGWARGEQPGSAGPPPDQERDALYELFDACGLSECFALFAAVILDTADVRAFDERAALVLELLKVPASTRFRLTEGLLARLRAEPDAAATHLPEPDLWSFVAWADARGMEPGAPLDMERLLGMLPP